MKRQKISWYHQILIAVLTLCLVWLLGEQVWGNIIPAQLPPFSTEIVPPIVVQATPTAPPVTEEAANGADPAGETSAQPRQPNPGEKPDQSDIKDPSLPITIPSPPADSPPLVPTTLPPPPTADALYQEATIQYKEGNYPGAIALYRQLIRQQPTYLNAYISLGNALDDQGNDKAAIATYQQALKLRPITPRHAFIHYNLGVTYYRRQDFSKAAKSFEQAIALQRNFLQAYETLGRTWEDLGNLPAARRVYEQLIRLDANSALAHWRLGIILGRQNRSTDSIKVLQRAEQLYRVAGNTRMATQIEQLLQRLGK